MNEFEQGFVFAGEQEAGMIAAELGAEYVEHVDDAIAELYRRMNAYDYYKATVPAQESLKGFIAEEWASGTANVDAAVKDLPRVVHVFDAERSQLGSPDVGVDGGLLYQLKTMNDPADTVQKLGTTLFDRYKGVKASEWLSFEEWAAQNGFEGRSPSDLLYDGQFGMVASDKLKGCQFEAFKRLAKAKALGKADEVARWQKVSDSLTDRIRLENGVESRPMTLEEARQKAISVSKNQKLEAADDGMTTAELIHTSNILQQALKAGVTAATISAVVKVAPEIYKAIDYLIHEGELDEDSLRAIGAATADGGATGFVNGSATAAITIAAGKGVFGETIKAALSKPLGPTVVGTLVVLTIETCKEAYGLARGRMSTEQFAGHLSQGVYVSVLSLVGAGVASLVAPEAAISAIIGSIAGSAVGALTFSPLKACLLKVSSASGFTFFGLVDQDYQVPPAMLKKLGVKGARYKVANVAKYAVASEKYAAPSAKGALLHTLDVAIMDRDIVGLNKVGYVLR